MAPDTETVLLAAMVGALGVGFTVYKHRWNRKQRDRAGSDES